MRKIKVLNKNLSNMIAAGEVVERPASVVKELVENSIDSGADIITVEIRGGGKTYIRVTDNGCGMTKEDAKTAFLRHATSKISCEADLFNISTMGFRGEALAAIAAVSKVELLTAVSLDYYGTEIIIEGGEEISCKEVGLPEGTTIIVRDLFYNTPARMNFLKKDATESANIVSLINKFAIGYPNVSFKLISDGRMLLSTDKSLELIDTVYSVFGKEISDSLIKAERLGDDVCVTGYVGAPRCSRSNRNYQLFYINKRIVKSKTITAALDRAYHNLLMNGKYAVCVLFLSLPYNKVDVNVHPTKTEVKFSDEKKIFDAVYYAVKDALEKEPQINNSVLEFFEKAKLQTQDSEPPVNEKSADKSTDVFSPLSGTQTVIAQQESNREYEAVNHASDYTVMTEIKHNRDKDIPTVNVPPFSLSSKKIAADDVMRDSGYFTRESKLDPDELSEKFCTDNTDDSYMLKPEIPYRYIGEIFKTYIIIESGNSFYLIDKHAAHERILFNKIYDRYKDSEKYCQQLLAGIPVTLSPEEADIARRNKDKLAKLGYEFDEFGDYDVILRTIPYVISPGDTVSGFTEMIEILSSDKNQDMTEFENATLKMLSCKAAIKAGFDSSDEELERFIKNLLLEGNVNYCPHGRPIICEYSKESVEKAFKRIL
ncbi:MAG: DNA mismatch repair endonuclease MutL [Clostridia bacterium]|nr:DNA mismatch repair endonuclease MutL [Clostridia bacterium]